MKHSEVVFLRPPMHQMLAWCWARKVPIGCRFDRSRGSNSTGRGVGCWRWKASLGARRCLSRRAKIPQSWCGWWVRTWACANTSAPLVFVTSYICVSLSTCRCNSSNRKAAERFNYPVTETCGVVTTNADDAVTHDTLIDSGYQCMSGE